jgi:hypothetical protein
MQLEAIRCEIERMRAQVGRQRKEILQLQRAGIPTASADEAATGNREFFWNKPHSIGGGVKKGDVP